MLAVVKKTDGHNQERCKESTADRFNGAFLNLHHTGDTETAASTPWGNKNLWQSGYYDIEIINLMSGLSIYGTIGTGYDCEIAAFLSRSGGRSNVVGVASPASSVARQELATGASTDPAICPELTGRGPGGGGGTWFDGDKEPFVPQGWGDPAFEFWPSRNSPIDWRGVAAGAKEQAVVGCAFPGIPNPSPNFYVPGPSKSEAPSELADHSKPINLISKCFDSGGRVLSWEELEEAIDVESPTNAPEAPDYGDDDDPEPTGDSVDIPPCRGPITAPRGAYAETGYGDMMRLAQLEAERQQAKSRLTHAVILGLAIGTGGIAGLLFLCTDTSVHAVEYAQDGDVSHLYGVALNAVGAAGMGAGMAATAKTAAMPGTGTVVYRVCGPAGSRASGGSYTPINPGAVNNLRYYAGLPRANTGEYVVQAVIRSSSHITRIQPATKCGSNMGGLTEIFFDQPALGVIRMAFARVSPAF